MKTLIELIRIGFGAKFLAYQIQIGFNTMLDINRPYCSAEAFKERLRVINHERDNRAALVREYCEANRDVNFWN